jgi:hypothetical protein
MLYITKATFFSTATFHNNFDFTRNYYAQFGRFIPFDFVNQVIPVIFKVTGREVLDVVTLPPGKVSPVTSVMNISTQILLLVLPLK